jgi:hypothetical protein
MKKVAMTSGQNVSFRDGLDKLGPDSVVRRATEVWFREVMVNFESWLRKL